MLRRKLAHPCRPYRLRDRTERCSEYAPTRHHDQANFGKCQSTETRRGLYFLDISIPPYALASFSAAANYLTAAPHSATTSTTTTLTTHYATVCLQQLNLILVLFPISFFHGYSCACICRRSRIMQPLVVCVRACVCVCVCICPLKLGAG